MGIKQEKEYNRISQVKPAPRYALACPRRFLQALSSLRYALWCRPLKCTGLKVVKRQATENKETDQSQANRREQGKSGVGQEWAASSRPIAGKPHNRKKQQNQGEKSSYIYIYMCIYICICVYICRGQEQTRQKEKQEATVCCCFFTHPCHPGSSCLCCRPTVMRNMQCTPDEQAYSIINQGVLLASEQDQPSRQRKNVDEGCQSDLALHQRQ